MKGFPTFLTFMRFLTSINALRFSFRAMDKGTFPIFFTFFAFMNSLMLNQVWPTTKGFPTFSTFTVFFLIMTYFMLNIVWLAPESFLTSLAFVGFHSGMNYLRHSMNCALNRSGPFFRGYYGLSEMSLLLSLQVAFDFSVISDPSALKVRARESFYLQVQWFNFITVLLWK